MEDNNKVDVSVSGLGKLLNKSYESFIEERDLALERYRRQDEMITSGDDFVLQGKTNVDYLKLAADRSNAIFAIGKLVSDIVNKDIPGSKGGDGASGTGDAQKAEIIKLLKEMEEGKPESTDTENSTEKSK